MPGPAAPDPGMSRARRAGSAPPLRPPDAACPGAARGRAAAGLPVTRVAVAQLELAARAARARGVAPHLGVVGAVGGYRALLGLAAPVVARCAVLQAAPALRAVQAPAREGGRDRRAVRRAGLSGLAVRLAGLAVRLAGLGAAPGGLGAGPGVTSGAGRGTRPAGARRGCGGSPGAGTGCRGAASGRDHDATAPATLGRPARGRATLGRATRDRVLHHRVLLPLHLQVEQAGDGLLLDALHHG